MSCRAEDSEWILWSLQYPERRQVTMRQVKITSTKLSSLAHPTETKTLIIQDDERREFFRYNQGNLVEYDLTKANKKQVLLTREELDVINETETETN